MDDIVDLSVCVVCQKYEEPELCGSAANFFLGEKKEGDTSCREDVEAGGSQTCINDSNKCHCLLPSIASPRPAVNHHDQADKSSSIEGEVALCDSDAKMDDAFIVPKKNIPKRSKKFGRGKSRGGNKKVARDTTVPQEGTNEVIPSATTSTCNSSAHAKYLTKAQLPKQYTESKKKRMQSEKEAATALKKLAVVSAQCKSLAAIAQERRKVIVATEQTCSRLVADANALIELAKATYDAKSIKSEKKRMQSEKEAATALKKLAVVSAQCKSLAAIAQERRKVIVATEQTCTRLVADADASIELAKATFDAKSIKSEKKRMQSEKEAATTSPTRAPSSKRKTMKRAFIEPFGLLSVLFSIVRRPETSNMSIWPRTGTTRSKRTC